MTQSRYKVTGMACDACVSRVREALAATPGVVDAEVDLASGRVIVDGDADANEITRALAAAGYPATVDEG